MQRSVKRRALMSAIVAGMIFPAFAAAEEMAGEKTVSVEAADQRPASHRAMNGEGSH